jgi:uncharacterized protein with PQ loop repeat
MTFQEDNLATILGIIVNVLSFISDISQIYHNVKYETTDGLSIIHIVCELLIAIFFLLYGIHLKLLMIITLNCTYLLSVSVMLFYWIRNNNSNNNNNRLDTCLV